MKPNRTSRIAQAIADNPWASLQDALLLSGVMIVAILLSLEYDLFRFDSQLTAQERKITLSEMIFLTALLAAGIVAFVLRRLHERRIDAEHRVNHQLETHRLQRQVQRDHVTGLLNHRGVLAVLTAVTSAHAATPHTQTLIVFGIDGIEDVNDVYGRATGDNVLKAVADRFRAVLPRTDILLGRLEGAEFVVLAPDLDKDQSVALASALISSLQADILVDHQTHKLGVSCGATIFEGPRRTPAEALHEADLAMRRAKEQRQPGPVFYNAPSAA